MIPKKPRKHSLFQYELKCEGRTVPGSTTAAAGMQISLPSLPLLHTSGSQSTSQVLVLGTINSEE